MHILNTAVMQFPKPMQKIHLDIKSKYEKFHLIKPDSAFSFWLKFVSDPIIIIYTFLLFKCCNSQILVRSNFDNTNFSISWKKKEKKN